MKNENVKASFIEERANGKSIQRNCLVNLQTGKIEVGSVKLAGLKVDESSPVVNAILEYRGQEFEMDSKKTAKGMEYELTEAARGAFLMKNLKPTTMAEDKEMKIDKRWKPKYND